MNSKLIRKESAIAAPPLQPAVKVAESRHARSSTDDTWLAEGPRFTAPCLPVGAGASRGQSGPRPARGKTVADPVDLSRFFEDRERAGRGGSFADDLSAAARSPCAESHLPSTRELVPWVRSCMDGHPTPATALHLDGCMFDPKVLPKARGEQIKDGSVFLWGEPVPHDHMCAHRIHARGDCPHVEVVDFDDPVDALQRSLQGVEVDMGGGALHKTCTVCANSRQARGTMTAPMTAPKIGSA